MHFTAHRWTLVVLSAMVTVLKAQQFADNPTPMSYPGISDSCFQALNTSVSCDSILLDVGVQDRVLDSNTTASLCTSGCQQSLQNVRQKVSQACGANDTIIFQGNIYPATYIGDNFLYQYSLSCLKDAGTGQYCDALITQWRTQSNASNECSYCFLKADQLQLNSPFGYDSDFASQFSSTTSSCGASSYTWTTPTTYGTTPTASASSSAAPSPSCAKTYTTTSGDTPNSIAFFQNVSTFSVIYNNQLFSLDGDQTLNSSTSLCLQAPCAIYQLGPEDNCTTILQNSTGISFSQLLAWNPNINNDCSNLNDYPNYMICLSSPWGSVPNPSITSNPAVSVATTAAPVPTNAPSGSNRNCGRWYTVQDGDYCDKVSVDYSISLHDFYFLNPEINANCTNLLLGEAYCVEAVGNIQTYANYSGGANFTVPPQTYMSPTSSPASASATPTLPPTNQYPNAPNTISGCLVYMDYVNYTATPANNTNNTVGPNDCQSIATSYGVSVANLTTWNPSLSSKNCSLQANYSYCVQKTALPPPPADYSSNLCQHNTTAIINGTISRCTCFWNVPGADNDTNICDDYASWFGIGVSDMTNWNSWLSTTNCTASLFSGLQNSWDSKPVCMGVNGTSTPGTTPSATSSVPPTTTTASKASPSAPTQSGINSNCTQYYTCQSGDSCSSIENKFGITFSQFLNWNPAIKSDCTALWVNEAYCVAAPGINSAEPAAPTRTGTLSDSSCKRYYSVQSGDSCSGIESQFSITLQQLYNWNTNIGSQCNDLEVGYAVCVSA